MKIRRCEDEQMWRWADVKMSRCEDEKVWRWEDVKMRRFERRCEDEKVWRWNTDPHYWKNPALRRSREKKVFTGFLNFTKFSPKKKKVNSPGFYHVFTRFLNFTKFSLKKIKWWIHQVFTRFSPGCHQVFNFTRFSSGFQSLPNFPQNKNLVNLSGFYQNFTRFSNFTKFVRNLYIYILKIINNYLKLIFIIFIKIILYIILFFKLL